MFSRLILVAEMKPCSVPASSTKISLSFVLSFLLTISVFYELTDIWLCI